MMDCSSVPVLDFVEWSQNVASRIAGERHPLKCTFELTERCNLRCVHCYINQPAGSTEARSKEMSTAEIKHLLEKIAEAGCLFLVFTGGEALLRPDFPEIYRHAVQLGFLVTVFTNGTLITPAIADLFAEYHPMAVEITLYGATRETYEKVTGVQGSFDLCMQGIDRLMARGLKVRLKTFVITLNRHELPQIQSLAEDLGVEFRSDGLMWPRLDGDKDIMQYQLSLEELVDIQTDDQKKLLEWEQLLNYDGLKTRAEKTYICGAGNRSFHVDSAGRMSACLSLRDPSFDLLRMSFKEAWEQMGEEVKRKREKYTPCVDCTIGNLCDQCPAWSQTVNGDLETPVEFICKLAHLRLERIENSDIIIKGVEPL